MGYFFRSRFRRRVFRRLQVAAKRFRKAPLPIRIVLVLLLFAVVWIPYSKFMAIEYHADYAPLLNTIGQGESRGNYNAYYGNAGNNRIRFTGMTISAVLQWQQAFLQQGQPSSAVGKYQILRPTLLGLVAQLKLNPQTTYFDPHTQDKLAAALLERRGAQDYLRGKLSREQFAANLAMEWASLPKATGNNPSQSYYAGDGLNKSQVTMADVYQALTVMKQTSTRQP